MAVERRKPTMLLLGQHTILFHLARYCAPKKGSENVRDATPSRTPDWPSMIQSGVIGEGVFGEGTTTGCRATRVVSEQHNLGEYGSHNCRTDPAGSDCVSVDNSQKALT